MIQLAPGRELDDAAIVAGVRAHLADYKSPKHVVRVPELIRGPNGKSDYRWALDTAKDALEID